MYASPFMKREMSQIAFHGFIRFREKRWWYKNSKKFRTSRVIYYQSANEVVVYSLAGNVWLTWRENAR